MASLIDQSYFNGPLIIGQNEQPVVAQVLTSYITRYEAEFLEEVLGVKLYAEFLAGITGSIPKYLVLRDGDPVPFPGKNGVSSIWKGLRISTSKRSPIANFIWCKYTEQHQSFTTGSGDKVVNGENSTNASSKYKMIAAWNEMVKWNHSLWYYLRNYSDLYDYTPATRNNNLLSYINPIL